MSAPSCPLSGEELDRSDERRLRRALKKRENRLERSFRDVSGAEHEIRSCPVRGGGGRYLYDDSETWGLRALGHCGDGFPEQLEALAREYAERCEGELAPVCRSLSEEDIAGSREQRVAGER